MDDDYLLLGVEDDVTAGPGRWNQSGPSEFPWEQDALDHIRNLMPDAEPYRAWATFSFTAATGHVREVDLLVAVPAGLFLIEIKSHPGRLTNRGGTWLFRAPDRTRSIDNPLHLTDRKSKEMKSRLEWAAGKLRVREQVPFINPAVFLSAPGLRSELDEQQKIKVYGCNDRTTGLPKIWDDLLDLPPQSERRRVTPAFSRQLPRLMREVGIAAAQAHLRLGRWQLDPRTIESGTWWQDRLARDELIRDDQRRARIYLSGFQASGEKRRAVERAAQRGYAALRGLNHRGIVHAVDYSIHDAGPAVLFEHRETDVPLDRFMDAHGETLDIADRLEMVRQVAEALDYAHRRHLFHRALGARSVWVSTRSDGRKPELRIGDWEVATRPSETTGLGSLETSNPASMDVPVSTRVYLAPEFGQADADPLGMDVYGLGAISHLIVTGKPPAPSLREVEVRLGADGGLMPSTLVDGLPAALDELVWDATHPVSGDRIDATPDVSTFLARLDQVWEELTRPDDDLEEPDALEVEPGQRLDGDWVVTKVLGTGSTARALLVTRRREPEGSSEPEESRVYKVALDEDKAARLHDEAAVLRRVERDPRIVKIYDGPFSLGRHTAIAVEQAGQGSLGHRLRTEGPCTSHELERFGDDLFVALDHLAGEKVWHRDLKPDNLGVRRRKDRSQQLVLFDFSLSRAPERDIEVGTRAYLDPFLGEPRRPVYDAHAEWYAAAVTLHEMASGERPVWGDGITNPNFTQEEETPALAAEVFEPSLREGLIAFFNRALHRDAERRFTTLREMQDAWRAVFTGLDAQRPPTTAATSGDIADSTDEARDAAAARATLETPLAAAGLSPRAVEAAASLGAQTVGELLAVPPFKVTKVRGVGRTIRSELSRRARQWRLLAATANDLGTTSSNGPVEDPVALIGHLDDLVESLLADDSDQADAVRTMLVLPNNAGDLPRVPFWPKQSEVINALGATESTVSPRLRDAVDSWAADERVAGIRSSLVDVLSESGRVMEARELTGEILARWGARVEKETHRIAYALAMVRIAAEAETHEVEPRLIAERSRGRARDHERILVALQAPDGSGLPGASELIAYAASLGSCADVLAAADPLHAPTAVLRELRAVRAPEGNPPLPDSRLVALAAAASTRAAATARLEIYPTDLNLARALRMTQAAINPGPDGLDPDELVARLRSRFPAQRLPGGEPTPLQIEDALREAGFEFEYADGRFRRKAPAPTLSALTASTAAPAHRAQPADETSLVVLERLDSAVQRGGFLTLNVRLKDAPDAAALVEARFGIPTIDVGAEFVATLKSVADEHGRPWNDVLRADERFSQTGIMPRGFADFVEETWQRVNGRLSALSGTVLLHDAGAFARYPGGRDVLVLVQRAARSGVGGPSGLWLLCPTQASKDRPVLDNLVIEVLENEWIELPSSLLASWRVEMRVAA
ncbi:BREX system serine/threonine kinase PglW [Micromonospora sp. NPDC049523]|uniref:BREX system serine/threonine kinase PglW n=1 Tax=Micromonospora sp. NPDC049523 TaxID=3155921 RepID=UPI00342D87E4